MDKNETEFELSTIKHIQEVQKLMLYFAGEIIKRATIYDKSKLEEPERELFSKYTSKLFNITYGSEEYYSYFKELKPALDHHYRNNSHHPEYYINGIEDMDLMDVVEMFCDWSAATKRHKDGDIISSINKNKDRFKMSEQLVNILYNSAFHPQIKE